MDWLYRISITCFAASYLVVFLFEVARVFFQRDVSRFLRTGLALAGLFAHTVYLICQSQLQFTTQGIWLGSWFGWCLSTAWVLAAFYIWISLRKPDSIFGLFLLPAIMLLIRIGMQFGSDQTFSLSQSKTVWSTIHGLSLLLGTAVVAVGFIFGVLYLLQANRLKRKILPSETYRLPSLEWLQRASERSLIVSAALLAIGLVSGIAINQVRGVDTGEASSLVLAWTDPVIWTSGILFAWLLASTLFNLCYRPARQGRKVAYLVVTSFLFLVLELGIVWWAGHAAGKKSGWLRPGSGESLSTVITSNAARYDSGLERGPA